MLRKRTVIVCAVLALFVSLVFSGTAAACYAGTDESAPLAAEETGEETEKQPPTDAAAEETGLPEDDEALPAESTEGVQSEEEDAFKTEAEAQPEENTEEAQAPAAPALGAPAPAPQPQPKSDVRSGVIGWDKTGAGERYYYADSKFYRGTVVTIKGKRYAFDDNGYLKHWLFTLGGHTYYANSRGELVTARMMTIKGNKYYFNRYGAAAMGRFTGPDGRLYYSTRGGVIHKYLFTEGGHTYYANGNGQLVTSKMMTIKGNKYYFNRYGAAETGKFTGPDGKLYYAASNGVIHKYLFHEGGHTYYANGNGQLVTSRMMDIKGKTYYFNKYGAANMGRFTGPGGKQYYADRNGVIHKYLFTEGGNTYYANGRGELATREIVTMHSTGESMYFDRTGAKGILVRGKARTSASVSMEIPSPAGRSVVLEMYQGGKWVKKGTVRLPATDSQTASIALPDQWWPYEASEWRVTAAAAGNAPAYTSKTICVAADRFYQNPKGMVQLSNTISKHGLSYYTSPVQTNNASTRKDHVEAMIDRAYDYLGDPFVVCQSRQPGPGVDCSGIVMQSCYAAGVDLWPSNPYRHRSPQYEYESRYIYKMNTLQKVAWANRQRGDLIFYSKNGTIMHVAIYLGNNKVIHSWPGGVRVSSVYGWGDIAGVRRVFH